MKSYRWQAALAVGADLDDSAVVDDDDSIRSHRRGKAVAMITAVSFS